MGQNKVTHESSAGDLRDVIRLRSFHAFEFPLKYRLAREKKRRTERTSCDALRGSPSRTTICPAGCTSQMAFFNLVARVFVSSLPTCQNMSRFFSPPSLKTESLPGGVQDFASLLPASTVSYDYVNFRVVWSGWPALATISIRALRLKFSLWSALTAPKK